VSTEGREPFFVWLGHNGVGIAGLAATVIGAGVGTGFALAAKKAADNSDTVATQIQQRAMMDNVASSGICSNPLMKIGAKGSTFENATPDAKAQEAQKFEQACSLLVDDLDKRDKDRTYATAGFVLAGVGFTATLAAYFLTANKSGSTARSASSPHALVLPVVGPAQSGLVVVGSF
jgi:hypothetical protein